MMTRVAIKIRRGVKSCERETSKRELKEAVAPELLSRDMTVCFDMGEACQLLFMAAEELPNFNSTMIYLIRMCRATDYSTSENNSFSRYAQHTFNKLTAHLVGCEATVGPRQSVADFGNG
jgi:hypothetical protein